MRSKQKRILIVSGNHAQSRHFAQINRLKRSEWRHCSDRNDVYTYRPTSVWLCGTFSMRTDAISVAEQAESMAIPVETMQQTSLIIKNTTT